MWGSHKKSRWALVILLCLQGYTCEQGAAGPSEPPEEASENQPKRARPKRSAVPAPAVAPAPEGTAQHEDLLALLHLADVYDPAGLFIDFGTAARPKYTIGNWNSGWLGESREGGARVSTFGKTARLYLPAARKEAMQLRFRAKPYATGALIVYVNGKTAGEARMTQGDGFQGLRHSNSRSSASRRRKFDHAARDQERPGSRQSSVGRDRLVAIRAIRCGRSDCAASSRGEPSLGVGRRPARDRLGAWGAGRLVHRGAGRRQPGVRIRPCR